LESGVVIAQGLSVLRRAVPEILEDADNELIDMQRVMVSELYEELVRLDERLSRLTRQLDRHARADQQSCRLMDELAGVGPLGASALVSAVADARTFDRGRQLSAWLGLVPRQFSTGGRSQLGKMTKAGQGYVRQLLIHGARSVISHLGDKPDRQSIWLRALVARAGVNKAAVALANKNARMAWAIMCKTA